MLSGKPRVWGSWFFPFVLLCGGCNKPKQVTNALTPPAVEQRRSDQPRHAACALLTTEEVGAIQGATIINAKSSSGPSAGMLMSQCYYTSREPNQSVSLAVIEGDPENASGSNTRNYWQETIRHFTAQAEDKEKGEEKNGSEARGEEEKKTPPRKVDGVGDEAYWSGNRFGGALYVLTKDLILRISVGGADNEQTKIDKCKALAQKAIERA
jgi:hypothetical protein